MSGLSYAIIRANRGHEYFFDIGYPHQMWYDLDCTNVRKIFIGGDFIPKKETRLGFTNSNLETDLIKVHLF